MVKWGGRGGAEISMVSSIRTVSASVTHWQSAGRGQQERRGP